MAVTIPKYKVKRLCYILGASKERSPRATKIAEVIDAKVIDCPSKLKRYTTFPIALLMRLVFSSYNMVIVNNIPTHILFSVWLASKFRRFILVTDFVNLWGYAVRKKFRFLSWIVSRSEMWFYKRIDYGLAINEALAKCASDAGVNRVNVVYDAADHNLFKPSFNMDPIVVVAANLRRDEGVDILLKAMQKVKDKMPTVDCLVAGAGEEEHTLRNLVEDLGIDSHVHFLGWIPNKDLPKVYQRASIGVAPIRMVSPLALPIKLFEYMSCGLAVISSDTSTVRTIIENGKNGLLFPPEDSNTLATIIMRVLLDRDLMAKLQKAARNTVEAGLNWKAEAEKLRRFVETILSDENA